MKTNQIHLQTGASGRIQAAFPGSEEVNIPAAPQGKALLKWLGPSFLWMLSSAGSGELLFTPRIASLYGYTLLWALLLAVFLKWFINQEMGRYTVCTGGSFFDGLRQIPGPKNWAVWLTLVPQVVVAIATLAGIAGAAATSLVLFAYDSLKLWTVVLLVVFGAIIYLSRYGGVDKMASWLSILISLVIMTAAISVSPAGHQLATGLLPALPDKSKLDEVLPWLGFALAGASGMIWYGQWVGARQYGAAALNRDHPLAPQDLKADHIGKLKGWLKVLTIGNLLAVGGALLITVAFLILGTELLLPKKLVPEESQVSEVLGKLLGDLWGKGGFWFMIGAIVVTLCGTLLSNQDGFSRMFAEGTQVLLADKNVASKWKNPDTLKKHYTLWLLILMPVAIYFILGNPIGLLKVAGALTAALIPIVAGLILYINLTQLPPALRPSGFSIAMVTLAILFFFGFAGLYILQLTSVIQL